MYELSVSATGLGGGRAPAAFTVTCMAASQLIVTGPAAGHAVTVGAPVRPHHRCRGFPRQHRHFPGQWPHHPHPGRRHRRRHARWTAHRDGAVQWRGHVHRPERQCRRQWLHLEGHGEWPHRRLDARVLLVPAAGVATELVVTVQPPASVPSGSPFGLVVTAEDSFGNVGFGYSGPRSTTHPGPEPVRGITCRDILGQRRQRLGELLRCLVVPGGFVHVVGERWRARRRDDRQLHREPCLGDATGGPRADSQFVDRLAVQRGSRCRECARPG